MILTLYNRVLTFNEPEKEAFRKHCGNISHNVSYPSQNKFQFFTHNYFVVCKCFQFGMAKNFVLW